MNQRVLISMLAAVALTGCRSTAPKSTVMVKPPGSVVASNAPAAKPAAPLAVVPPVQVKAEAKPAEMSREQRDRMKALEKSIAERQSAQKKMQREMEDLRNDLFETAQTIREIKLRADAIAGIELTNAMAVATLQDSLRVMQGLPATEVKALQDALAREKQAGEKSAPPQQSPKPVAEVKTQVEPSAGAQNAPPLTAISPSAPVATPSPSPVPSFPSAAQLAADGKQLLRQGKLSEAEQAFRSALSLSPGFVGASVGLAACRYNAGDLDGAKTLVRGVLSTDKRNAQALGLKGIIAWREGSYRDAVDVLGDAIKSDPGDAQLHNYMGIALHAREKYADAVEELRKAVKLDPENAEAQYNLSVLLATARTPVLQEARMHYEQALKLGNPRDEAMDKIIYGASLQ